MVFCLNQNLPFRKGLLKLPAHQIQTPTVFVCTSHFLPKHLTPDILLGTCSPKDVVLEMYIEDLIEKRVFLDETHNIRDFAGIPEYAWALATRDYDYLDTGKFKTGPKSFSILNNSGIQKITLADFIEASKRLYPDVVIIPSGPFITATSRKRISKDNEYFQVLASNLASIPTASFLNVDFWGTLSSSNAENAGAFTISKSALPQNHTGPVYHRLSANIQEVKNLFARGVDIFNSLYPYELTELGIAMNIVDSCEKNMLLSEILYQADSFPISISCECVACRNGYSRAYIHHLLLTKEMLAQVLLASHNLFQYIKFVKSLSIVNNQ